MRTKNETETVEISRFIQSMLVLGGLKRGKDFTIRKSQLRIIKHPTRGKLLSTLRELYPEYSFYWESPRILKWFKS